MKNNLLRKLRPLLFVLLLPLLSLGWASHTPSNAQQPMPTPSRLPNEPQVLDQMRRDIQTKGGIRLGVILNMEYYLAGLFPDVQDTLDEDRNDYSYGMLAISLAQSYFLKQFTGDIAFLKVIEGSPALAFNVSNLRTFEQLIASPLVETFSEPGGGIGG